jgi:hypothetical protein
MRVPPAGALLLLAVAGCSAPSPKSPCEGLVYTDAGLTREQYAPCAKAMVAKLDELSRSVEVIFDKDLPKAERLRGRQACLKASSELSRLMARAGGKSKLLELAWDDTALTRFNWNVESARMAYFMYCYYGAVGPEPPRIDPIHEEARRFVATLR